MFHTGCCVPLRFERVASPSLSLDALLLGSPWVDRVLGSIGSLGSPEFFGKSPWKKVDCFDCLGPKLFFFHPYFSSAQVTLATRLVALVGMLSPVDLRHHYAWLVLSLLFLPNVQSLPGCSIACLSRSTSRIAQLWPSHMGKYTIHGAHGLYPILGLVALFDSWLAGDESKWEPEVLLAKGH